VLLTITACRIGKSVSLTSTGSIHYPLKTSSKDGTTHVIFNPLDFIAKLPSPVPKPRVNLKRFNGVFVGVPHHVTANTNSSHNGQKRQRPYPIRKRKQHNKTTKQQNNSTLAFQLIGYYFTG
jgi:hypothetical protein